MNRHCNSAVRDHLQHNPTLKFVHNTTPWGIQNILSKNQTTRRQPTVITFDTQVLVDMIPDLGKSSRVVISGNSGRAGPLVTALQERGVRDILLVETSQRDSLSLQSTFAAESLGNAIGVLSEASLVDRLLHFVTSP